MSNSNMNNNLMTAEQEQILSTLKQNFGIKPERILFINPRDKNDPWIPADELESIARQVGGFKHVAVTHDKFIPERQQVAFTAIVVDKNDTTYTRSGIATVGEHADIDEDTLAYGRALGAALRAAGFHPYRSGSVVDFEQMRTQIEDKHQQEKLNVIETEASLRTNDLKQIHALAAEKGLIVGANRIGYNLWLTQKFGVRTTIQFDHLKRQQVINALRNYKDENLVFEDEFDAIDVSGEGRFAA